jgi:hypothetical protein
LICFRITRSTEVFEKPKLDTLAEFKNKFTSIAFRKLTRSKTLKEDYVSSLHLLEENSATTHTSVMFPRYNPLSEIFIRKLNQLISNGEVAKLEKIQHPDARPASGSEQNIPEVLSYRHLEIGFVAVFICLGLSFVVFLGECITGYVVRRM